VLPDRGVGNFCGLPGDYLPLAVAAEECSGVAIVGDGGRRAGAVLFVGDQAEGNDSRVRILVDGDVLGGKFGLPVGTRRARGASGDAFDDVGFIADVTGGVGVDDVVGEEAIEAGNVVDCSVLQKLIEHGG